MVSVEKYELKFVNGIIDKDKAGYEKQRALYLKKSLSSKEQDGIVPNTADLHFVRRRLLYDLVQEHASKCGSYL